MNTTQHIGTLAFILSALALAGCATDPGSKEDSNGMNEIPVIEKSEQSLLPIPPLLRNAPLPSLLGTLEDPSLKILDWAGFEAAATYSFDDGQPSHIRHWPALKATGVPMTWYLWTGNNSFSGYDATWKDALAAGHELGNHTKSHKRLTEYSGPDAIVNDMDDCAAYLRERLGQEGTPSFAYPFGETGWKAYFDRSADKEGQVPARFLLARTVNGGRIGARASTDPLLLPTFFVNGNHREADFIRELDGALASKAWTIFMYHSILPGDNWYAGVPLDSILASLDHARRGQKMWLDTVLNIGSYWYAARLFRALEPVSTDTGLLWSWTLDEGFPAGKYLRATMAGGRLFQDGKEVTRHEAGFYEFALDTGSLEWRRE